MHSWEYNVLQINQPNCPKLYFINKFINNHLNQIEGDYVEFGVFKGNSFLTIAYLLSLKNKYIMCHGFDSFEGFPEDVIDHEFDKIANFKKFHELGKITDEHYSDVIKLQKHKKFINNKYSNNLEHSDLSTNADFKTSLDLVNEIKRKAEYLKLKNLRLNKCNFLDIESYIDKLPDKISFCLLDVDLYLSYKATLPLVWERLSNNGLIFLDEYYSLKFPGAKIATDDFCKKFKIKPKKHLTRIGEFERYYLTK